MKKLALIFSLAFFAFIISASAQSSASSDKQTTATEKVVKSDDGAMPHGCCAHSTATCKAGSAKCCSMDKAKAEKSKAGCSGHSEAMMNERKTLAEAEKK